jgi:hypothetical protein
LTWWIGWVFFAGIALFTAGAFNAIEGLVALFDRDYYRAAQSGLTGQVDYRVYGRPLLAFGVLLASAGYGLVAGRTWARCRHHRRGHQRVHQLRLSWPRIRRGPL